MAGGGPLPEPVDFAPHEPETYALQLADPALKTTLTTTVTLTLKATAPISTVDVTVSVVDATVFGLPSPATWTLTRDVPVAVTLPLGTAAGSTLVAFTPDAPEYGMRPTVLGLEGIGKAIVTPTGVADGAVVPLPATGPVATLSLTLSRAPQINTVVAVEGFVDDPAAPLEWVPPGVVLTPANYAAGTSMVLQRKGAGTRTRATTSFQVGLQSNVQTTDPSPDPFYTSFMVRAEVPICFAADMPITMACSGRTRPVREVQVGHVVLDSQSRPHVVRRVTGHTATRLVKLAKDSLALDVPSSDVLVTHNHLVKLPAQAAVPAHCWGEDVELPGPVTVYHLGFDDWTWLNVHGLWCESMAWKPEHHQKRPYYKE